MIRVPTFDRRHSLIDRFSLGILDYVPRVARERKLTSVLSVGSGFGGFQSAVVLTRPRETTR